MQPQEFEVKESGPLRVAYFDFRDGPCTLSDQKCRARVINALRTEGEVNQVMLVGPMTKIYCSPELS